MKTRFVLCSWLLMGVAISLLTASVSVAKNEKHALGDHALPPAVYKKYLKKFPSVEMSAVALPTQFDARDPNADGDEGDSWVTPAKNQGSCGSCWAFATVGAVESHLLMMGVGPEDLSEQQQVSCNTAMWGCAGGNSNAILYYEGRGPVGEDYFPYTATDSTSCMQDVAAQFGYRVTDYHTVPVSIADFKQSLYTNGPSYWRYAVHNDFYAFWGRSPVENKESQPVYVNQTANFLGGHAILLIGWDDSKQALLCKNSWGTGGPNGDGTFWIAYEGHAANLGFGMANFSLVSLSCTSDADCDDGLICNGTETCDPNQKCQSGTPVTCSQNGSFCDGEEVCNELTGGCSSSGDPCGANELCDESTDVCVDLCGNGVCDSGENCSTCPTDCISGASGGTCGSCFKGDCDGKCNTAKDGANCSDCWSSYCCGDGKCEGDETNENCGVDCSVTTCGDGVCDYDESAATCPEDCPSEPEICTNGIDDDGDGVVDCFDTDCENDPGCATCAGFKDVCSSDSECCSNKCKNGVCR